MLVVKRDLLFFIFAFVVLFLFAGFRPVGLDNDSIAYVDFFNNIRYKNEYGFFTKEPTLWLFVYLSKNIIIWEYSRQILLLYAWVGVFVKLWSIYKVCEKKILGLVTYFFLFYILHEMTQIRVAVATGFFLYGLLNLAEGNRKAYLIKILIATLFHFSSIVALPLAFLCSKKINFYYIFLPILSLLISVVNFPMLALMKLTPVLPPFIGQKISVYLDLYKSGIFTDITLFNPFIVSIIGFYYFFYFNKDRFNREIEVLSFKITGWAIFVFYFFSALPVLAFRISEFYSVGLIVLLPLIHTWFKQKKLILLLVLSWMVAYFYFIMLAKNLNVEVIFELQN